MSEVFQKTPVVRIDFGGCIGTTLEFVYEQISIILSDVYSQHSHVATKLKEMSQDQTVSEETRLNYTKLLNDLHAIGERKASNAEMAFAVQRLCQMYFIVYNKKCLVLFDEVERPLHELILGLPIGTSKSNNDFILELNTFMKILIRRSFKENNYLWVGGWQTIT